MKFELQVPRLDQRHPKYIVIDADTGRTGKLVKVGGFMARGSWVPPNFEIHWDEGDAIY
jgi:hypothetical protein